MLEQPTPEVIRIAEAQEVLKSRTAAPTPGSEAEIEEEVEIEKLDP